MIERIASAISKKSRARKWAQFLALMTPGPTDTIIDIGVNTTEYSESDNYLERHYPSPENITAVGLETDFSEFNRRYPQVKTVTADGTTLPFADNTFDVSYSNAVIEHVGDLKKQEAFLRESVRVATRGYLTTPNRHFPIEVHTRVPLLHLLLPKHLFDRILTLIGKGWAAGDYMQLLSEKEVRLLCERVGLKDYRLIKNRFLGLPMTFTVVWNKENR